MTQTPAPPRVLLLNSVSDEREMYALALSAEGFVPVQAPDSARAFEYATVTPPALIVTDAVLERGDDGLTFARRIRQMDATRDVPIIVLSGRVVNVVKSTCEALDAGADLFLLKPCAPSLLVAKSRALLAKSEELQKRVESAMANASRLREQTVDRLAKGQEQLKRRD
jgi:DNA-binding response OmpR family regulator